MSTLQPIETRTVDKSRRPGLHDFNMSDQNPIDRAPVRAFVVLSVAYLIVTLSLSWLKLLWLDELITLHIARLPSIPAIWQALQRGVDPNPPVTDILVHFSRIIFGDHEFAYRLPAVTGYWIGMLSLFVYLKRRMTSTWALAGTVLSMTMGAFEYSYESRSYGIFYGLAMLAFLCWSRSVDGSRSARFRRAALLGMAIALAAGISTNYFAVLAFFPIAAGETVRTMLNALQLRREPRAAGASLPAALLHAVDLRVWAALALSASPLALYRGMISHSIAQFAPYAWNKVSLGQVADSYTQMVEVILYPILALFGIGFMLYGLRRRLLLLCDSCRTRVLPRWLAVLVGDPRLNLRIPAPELAAIFVFMAYPVLGFVIASVRGGMLSPRFVIPVCFGFAVAATFVAFQSFGAMPRSGPVMLLFLCAWFVCRESFVGYWYEEQKQCFYKVVDHLAEAEASVPSGSPIVIADPLLALTFQHYAPPRLAARVIFPVDFPAIRYFRHDDSPEENLWAGRNFLYTLPIVPLATFERAARAYLIIASDGNWLLEDLNRHHYATERLPINTRAGAIGGFTPLAHGIPAFYAAGSSDLVNEAPCSPIEPLQFQAADELPDSATFNPEGAVR
jgi:hypothetical protein